MSKSEYLYIKRLIEIHLITDNKEPMRKWFKRELIKNEGKFALKVNWKNK
jgi:hypothetical protein